MKSLKMVQIKKKKKKLSTKSQYTSRILTDTTNQEDISKHTCMFFFLQVLLCYHHTYTLNTLF